MATLWKVTQKVTVDKGQNMHIIMEVLRERLSVCIPNGLTVYAEVAGPRTIP